MGEQSYSPNATGRVVLLLTALTVVATAMNAIPAFLVLRGREPYVVYQTDHAQMLYPEDVDRGTIQKILRQHKLPDAFMYVILSNRGDAVAHEVIVALTLPGAIVALQTKPDPDSKPAWVKITREFDPAKDETRARYVLNDLGLTNNLGIKVSYTTEASSDPRVEIFFDGKPAIPVASITQVPDNARAISFIPTLKILCAGLLLSGFAYVFLRYRVSLLRPFARARTVAITRAWKTYKDAVVLHLATMPGVSLDSFTEGSLNAAKPEEFWDAVVSLKPLKIAIEVHTSAQRWPGIFGDEGALRDYALRLHVMAHSGPSPVTHVAIVNDENVWIQTPAAGLVRLADLLTGDGRPPKYIFAYGVPHEAARMIVDALRIPDALK